MLPSIALFFPANKYFNGPNNNIITIAFQRDCNKDCIKATVTILMAQTLAT